MTTTHAMDRDRAAASGGMDLRTLEARLKDIEFEPKWRPSADKCADYYEHKQISAARMAEMQESGEPVSITNLIQRTVNGALGQEAKTRLNWKVEADSDVFADVATVLSEKMHEAQREAKTDMAISEAYSSMLRTGIGWVEVSRNPNPLAYPYRVQAIHRNEVWWDWRAKQADKSDAQWMIRQRWVDVDEAITLVPEAREVLEIGTHSGPITEAMSRTIMTSRDKFESTMGTRMGFTRTEEEWLDNSHRKRVRMYSVYYKQHAEAIALVVGSRRVRFNPKNPAHVALAMSGAATLLKGPSYKIRHAMFAGPFRLFDVELPGQAFPLVPFVCYSCDDDYSPYGLIHGMIQPQDEFNQRRSRLLWLLKARQTFVDGDALDPRFNNILQMAKEVMRPDAVFVLNPNRKHATGMRIDSNPSLGAEQANVMESAARLIQDVPGLFAPQFGSNRVGAQSGVALDNLMEQSSASLGETSDNYRTSRQMVGDCLAAEITQDYAKPDMQVPVGSGRKRRTVTLNTKDEKGLPLNSMEDAQVKVALGDVPVTTAFKAQQQAFLSNALNTAGNDPLARAILLPALLEAGDLEHRHEYARWYRQKAGVPEPTDMSDEEAQAAEAEQNKAMQQQQQQMQQRAMELDEAERRARAALDEAKTLLTRAQTMKTAAEAEAIASQPDEDEMIARVLAEAAGQQAPQQQAPQPQPQQQPQQQAQQQAQPA